MALVKRHREIRRIGAKDRKRIGVPLLFSFSLILSVSILYSFGKTREILSDKKQVSLTTDSSQKLPQRVSMLKVEAETLGHESIFHEKIKSCLPERSKKCNLYVPEKTTAQRVAVMAPPGKFGVNFFKLLQEMVVQASKTHGVDLQLIPTNHVPPYGYGKTHGWTKIIRIVPQPLVIGALDALYHFLQEGQSLEDISASDIKSSLRLQIRYHCRLSHVAAHTSLMSLDLNEEMLDPSSSLDSLIEKLQDFLGAGLKGFQYKDRSSLVSLGSVLERDFYEMVLRSTNTLTHAQMEINGSILTELDTVLLSELRISRNLTAWPCESFWTVGSEDSPLELSPVVARVAKSMSPDCTANYTSCWVQRDLCEARGDGKCKGKKK